MRGSAYAIAILLFAPSASADPAAAEQAFRHGTEAYTRGDFAAAASYFEEAFHADPRAVTIYNAGLARQLASDSARAADDYAAALQMSDLTAAQAGDTRTRLAALETTLGQLGVAARGAVVSVGPDEKLPSPAHVHLAPGAYEVRAAWPDGASATQAIHVTAGVEQSITLERPAAQPVAQAPVVPTEAPSSSSRVAERGNAAPPSPPSRTLVYVSGAVGILGLGLGTIAGIVTLGDKSTIDQHCGLGGVRTQCDSQGKAAADSAQTTGLVSTIGFVAGAAGLVVAVVLLVTEKHEPAPGAARGWGPFVGGEARGLLTGARWVW
jgi:hypothetical protein